MNTLTKAADEKFCSECGSAIKAKAEICPKCGVRQSGSSGNPLGNTTANGRNRMVAALLAFFLGGIGGQKFYLGKTTQGVLCLLFFWTFIPAILGFIEFILLLLMNDEAFAQKYN